MRALCSDEGHTSCAGILRTPPKWTSGYAIHKLGSAHGPGMQGAVEGPEGCQNRSLGTFEEKPMPRAMWDLLWVVTVSGCYFKRFASRD